MRPTLVMLLAATACGPRQATPSEAAPSEATPSETAPAAAEEEVCPTGDPLFRCPVRDRGWLAICGHDSGLQYRFGPPADPEIVLPDEPALEGFSYEERHYVRSMGDVLVVESGRHAYEVRDMIGSGHPGEGASTNFTGVVVLEDGSEVARLDCAGSPDSDWSAIREALADVSASGQ